jgi:ribosomal protein S18 acetylase RimI-like enzyme
MIDALSTQGVRRAYLEVEESNASAIKLYASLGFRAVAHLPDYYGPARPGSRMMLEIAAQATSKSAAA